MQPWNLLSGSRIGSLLVVLLATVGFCVSAMAGGVASETAGREGQRSSGTVIVHPKFGGQILGYDIDPQGNEGVLSEYVNLSNGNVLAATETFDQATGQILSVVAKTETQDDFATQGVFGGIGLALYQHAGQNHFLTINPLGSNKFNGTWTPPIKNGYLLWSISVNRGTSRVAAYESSLQDGLTFVFSSDIAKNTFGRPISLASIINVDEFLHPLIALDGKTNQAVLADSLGCPEQICVTDIALVNLGTGQIREFTDNLGIGTVNGLALDPAKGIACTTTLIDQGVEFYDLKQETGFEVQIPNNGNSLKAGLDVQFDSLHKLFLIEQYSSTGDPNNPQPRIYVYDESGQVQETIPVLRLPVSPSLIALNPGKRIGFLPVIVEPQHQFLELQSFTY